jgi:hypothetical protein
MNRPRCGLDSTFGLVVAALLWLSCEPGHAQEIARVGERVRLRLADERVVGTIQTLDARSVTLGDPATGKTVAYDLGSVLGSEVSSGQRSRKHKAGRGALIGGVVGAVFGGIAASCRGGSGECGGLWIPIAAGVLGAGGATVGALVGAAMPPGETWSPVQLRGLHVAIMPVRGGVQVQASLGGRSTR